MTEHELLREILMNYRKKMRTLNIVARYFGGAIRWQDGNYYLDMGESSVGRYGSLETIANELWYRLAPEQKPEE